MSFDFFPSLGFAGLGQLTLGLSFIRLVSHILGALFVRLVSHPPDFPGLDLQ